MRPAVTCPMRKFLSRAACMAPDDAFPKAVKKGTAIARFMAIAAGGCVCVIIERDHRDALGVTRSPPASPTSCPIFLGLAPHRGRLRILELQPGWRTPRSVARRRRLPGRAADLSCGGAALAKGHGIHRAELGGLNVAERTPMGLRSRAASTLFR